MSRLTSSLRFSGFDAARLFFLALFASVIWLVLGANTAEASSSDAVSKGLGAGTHAPQSAHPSQALPRPVAPVAPVVAPVTQALPRPVAPAIEPVKHVAPVTQVITPVTNAAAPVLHNVAAPLESVAAPVTQVVAPVTETVDTVAPVTQVVNTVLLGAEDAIDAVEVVISPVLELPLLPSIPVLDDRTLPTVPPLPAVPGLPRPPALPTVLELLPGTAGQASAAGLGGVPPATTSAGDMAYAARGAGVWGFASAGNFLPEPANVAEATTAEALPPDDEQPPDPAVFKAQPGSASSGSGRGAPLSAADVATYRAVAQFVLSGRVPDAALAIPVNPSYNPGSSPD